MFSVHCLKTCFINISNIHNLQTSKVLVFRIRANSHITVQEGIKLKLTGIFMYDSVKPV